MRGERIIRIIALLGLCALVYYFSFDQGQKYEQARNKKLKYTLEVRENFLEKMSMELGEEKAKVRSLKAKLAAQPEVETVTEDKERVTLRVGTARIILTNKLVVALISMDRTKQSAYLRINFLRDDTDKTVELLLGQSLAIDLDGIKYKIILDQIIANSVSLSFHPEP